MANKSYTIIIRSFLVEIYALSDTFQKLGNFPGIPGNDEILFPIPGNRIFGNGANPTSWYGLGVVALTRCKTTQLTLNSTTK